MNPRLLLAFTALALAPFALTGCTGSDKPEPACESPEKPAVDLIKRLDALAVGIRTVDVTLAELVRDSVTDPSERQEAFAGAIQRVGKMRRLARESADEVAKAGRAVADAWQISAASLEAADARQAAEAQAALVAERFAAMNAALVRVDEAIAAHIVAVRDASLSLGSKPSPEALRAARPISARVTACGKAVGAAINDAVTAIKRVGVVSVPVKVVVEKKEPLAQEPVAKPAAETEPAKPAEAPKAPVEPAKPAEAPKAAEPAKPAEAVTPVAPDSAVKLTPAAKEAGYEVVVVAVPVKKEEAAKPVEAPKPVEPVKPVEAPKPAPVVAPAPAPVTAPAPVPVPAPAPAPVPVKPPVHDPIPEPVEA